MCAPLLAALPAVMAVVSAAGTAFGAVQQNKAQNANVKYQNQAAQATMEQARQQEALRREALVAQNQQQGAAAANDQLEAKLAATRASGEASSNFAGRGVAGGALASVLNDFAQQGARSRGASDQRLRFSGVQSNFNDRGNYMGMAATYADNPIRSKVPMDWMSTGMGALSAGANGYQTGLSIKSAAS